MLEKEEIKALKEATRAFEKEKADRKAAKEMIRNGAKEEVVGDILKYGMGYRCSTLFMIRKKYPDLDLSDVDLTQMEGYNILDPVDGSESIGDLNVGGATSNVTADQTSERET